MNIEERLSEAFQQLKGKEVPSWIAAARVISVDKEKQDCEVEFLHSKLKLGGVKLNAHPHEEHILIFPKIKSFVLVALIDEHHQAIVLAYSRVEEVVWKTANSALIFQDERVEMTQAHTSLSLDENLSLSTGGKISLKNTNQSLKNLLMDLASILSTLTVATGVGPSGLPLPTTIAKVESYKGKIQQLFS
ncbi:MAG: hypothetical protein OXB93_01245 [Cytophagales bacterium]|nr:hypothetical protein [Cytophagales bacterium]